MNKLVEAMVRHDVPGDVGDIDAQSFQYAMQQLHDRFVDERVKGWISPTTGQQQAPVSPEEAERRWQAALPRFQQMLLKTASKAADPDARRLGLSRRTLPASSEYRETGTDNPDEVPGVPMNPQEYEPGWAADKRARSPQGRSDRAAAAEPSLRRGESKARQMINKLLV